MINTLRMVRLAAVAALVLLLAATGFVLWNGQKPALGYGSAPATFQLASMNGGRFDTASLSGKPYALFFGFTHCPDICPTTMQDMTDTLVALGPIAKDFTVLFVSIDPERDTPDLLKTYLSAFDSRLLGLSGTQAEIDVLIKANGIFVEKVGTGESATYNHTASVLLFDKTGLLAGTIGSADTPDTRQAKIKRLIAG